MDKFNIEDSFKRYLELTKQDLNKMGEIQRKETRRAFMVGFSSAFVMFSFDIGEISDEKEAMKTIKSIDDQMKLIISNL